MSERLTIRISTQDKGSPSTWASTSWHRYDDMGFFEVGDTIIYADYIAIVKKTTKYYQTQILSVTILSDAISGFIPGFSNLRLHKR